VLSGVQCSRKAVVGGLTRLCTIAGYCFRRYCMYRVLWWFDCFYQPGVGMIKVGGPFQILGIEVINPGSGVLAKDLDPVCRK